MAPHSGKWPRVFVTAGAFAVFLFIALHRLTHASLWLDEAVEFWYSKVMTGPLPFESSANMLERINSTFQPPLYNILMYFWLKISTTQWWFRFFGVVAGCAGMAGFYMTVRRLTRSVYASAAAVLFASFVYQLVYYWQEAAEYCLLLASLFWALYFWVCLLQSPSRKNIAGLTVLSVVAVYSQYGAVFPVAVMLLSALVKVLKQRRRELTRTLAVSWTLAFLLAALPLVFFFFIPQITRQHEGAVVVDGLRQRGILLVDFLRGGAATFKWVFTDHLPDAVTVAVLAGFVLFAVLMFFRGSRLLKTMIAANAALWLLYYAALKVRLYAYGLFGNRYSLFFAPCWLVLAAALLHEARGLLKKRDLEKKTGLAKVFTGAVACLCAVYCFFSWQLKLKYNWEKDDIRHTVAVWRDANPEAKDTFVYPGAAAGFAYYLYYDPVGAGMPDDNIRYLPRLEGRKQYTAWYNGIFGETWPSEVYFTANHIGGDLKTMLKPFTAKGYRQEELSGRNVIRLVLEPPAEKEEQP